MNLRVFVHVASMQARQRMSYRADFWIEAVAGFGVTVAVAWFLWRAIFEGSGAEQIGGFTLRGMLVYYVCVALVQRVLGNWQDEGAISQDIYEGHLNRYLLYPTGYFSFKYAQGLGNAVPSVLQLALFAAILLLVFPLPAEVTLTAGGAARAVLALALAHLLNFLFYGAISLVAFWADNVWSLRVMARIGMALLGGFMIPLDAFPQWLRSVVQVLPFQYLFAFPVETLMGRIGLVQWTVGMISVTAWCCAIAAVGRILFALGERAYTGIGI